MGLKDYILLEQNHAVKDNIDLFMDTSGHLCEITFDDEVIDRGLVVDTSNDILDLARDGDLVKDHQNIYVVKEKKGRSIYVYVFNGTMLMGIEGISMLYKKIGNDYIGFEVPIHTNNVIEKEVK